MAVRARTYDQLCPVATSLDVLGDRWTILILRDLLWRGPHGYQELMDANPGMSPTLLSERLDSLTKQGLIEKIAVREGMRAAVHRLTDAGRGIEPIVQALYGFGAGLMTTMPLTFGKLEYLLWLASGNLGDGKFELDEYRVRLVVDDVTVDVEMAPGRVHVLDPEGAPDATIRATQDNLMALVAGDSDAAVEMSGDSAAGDQLVGVLLRGSG